MSKKAWNSLQWQPDFARPDRVTSQLNDITDVVTSQNGTKYLKINQTAFNSAENNFAYANEFNNMKNYRNSNSGSTQSYKYCDGTYSSRGGGGGFRIFGFGIGVHGSSSSGKEKCMSLFNTASRRSVNDLQKTSTDTTLDNTSVEKAGLSNWEVVTARQRSLGKVMFSQVSVCLQGGWVSLVPCLFWGWICLVPGPFQRGGYVHGCSYIQG